MHRPIPSATSVRLALSLFALVFWGAPAGRQAQAAQVSLDRVLDNAPAQSDRPSVTVFVLDSHGDPLPGIRVVFENVVTGNRGSRTSGDDGQCEPFFAPRGTRLEVTATSDRYYFGESGSDGIVHTSYIWDGTRDGTIYFKGSDRVVVPDIMGAEEGLAQLAVRHAGLEWQFARTDPCPGGLTFGTIDTCRARVGHVFGQTPAAGTRVAAFSGVEARIGIWPAQREVTQVSFGFDRPGTALSAQEACHRLLRDGFLTRIAGVLQRGCSGGGVMRQNPAGGARAAYGSEVELVLCADGPRERNVRLGQPLECSPRTTVP